MEDRHADVRKLRAELEAERHRIKQILREKVVELRQLKQEATQDRDRAVDLTSKKLQAEKAAELKSLRDSLLRQKEQELRHVVKYKDEEMKQIREQLVKDKSSAVRHAAAEARKEVMDSIHDQVSCDKAKLMDEVWALREQKMKLEEEVKLRRDGERQAAETLRRMRQEWDTEREQLLKQSRLEATRDYQQLRLAERVVHQKEQEAMQYQQHARMLEVEKETLGEELTRRKEAESWEKRSSRSKNDSFSEGLGDGHTSIVNKRTYDDKEKELLQKVSRLSSHIKVLEERTASLKSENLSLKQQSDKTDIDSKQSKQPDDKVKRLRQRNRELVTLARRLEDEKRALKESAEASTSVSSPAAKELEALKKSIAREKAKNQAEHVRQLAAHKEELEALTNRLNNKEQEIVALNASLQEAWQKRRTTPDGDGASSSADEVEQLRTEVVSLETAIRAVAREKLQYEKLVAENPTSAIRLQELQSEFGVLHHTHSLLVEKVHKKDEELNELQQKITETREAEMEMQKQLQLLADENATLAADLKACTTARVEMQQRITDMEQQLEHLHKAQSQCNELTEKLHETEESLAVVRQENQELQMVAEKAKTQTQLVEKQKVEMQQDLALAYTQLEERDAEILSLKEMAETQSSSYVSSDIVENMQARIRELEQECAEKELQCITLQDRMEKLHEAGIDIGSPVASVNQNGVIPEPYCSLDEQYVDGEEDRQNKQMPRLPLTSTSALIDSLEDSGSGSESASGRGSSLSGIFESRKSIGEESAFDLEVSVPQKEDEPKSKSIVETQLVSAVLDPSVSFGSLKDELMAAGEEVQSDYDSSSIASADEEEKSSDARKDNREDSDVTHHDSVMPSLRGCHDAVEVLLVEEQADNQANENTESFDDDKVLELLDDEEKGGNIPAQPSLDEAFVESPLPQAENNEMRGGDSSGAMAVFMAKFDYNPETDSPNDNPSSELAITAGEYIYIYGDMDEDGFYMGEKEDGRKGLIPSNFVDRVVSDSVDVEDQTSDDSSRQMTPVVEEEEAYIIPEELAQLVQSGAGYNLARELETVEEEEEEQDRSTENIEDTKEELTSELMDELVDIPPPCGLKVERKFARSLLVSWEKPHDIASESIHGYKVYVDEKLKASVKGGKLRALLEGLDFYAGRFKVSVRTQMAYGESTDPTDCLILGKDRVCPPKDVHCQVAADGSQSLHVMWTPVDPSDTPDSVPTGYKVYIDGVNAASVSGADTSSAYINQFIISTLYTKEQQSSHILHVTTVSSDGESSSSDKVTFTNEMLTKTSENNATDQLHDSGVYSRGEQSLPRSSKEENNDGVPVTSVQTSSVLSEEKSMRQDGEDILEDTVGGVVQSVKAEMSQQQQRQAEVVKIASSQVSSMFTIADNSGDSDSDSSSTSKSDSEGEAVEVFASPDKSEASMSRDDELSEGEIGAPLERAEQHMTEMELVQLKIQPSHIGSVRKFTALFNYDPAIMSPNEDGADEELEFKKGDIITVFGEKDEDGFYFGEVDGRQGFVPCNMVSELVTETLNGYPESEDDEQKAGGYDPDVSRGFESVLHDRKKMVAIYDYDPQEHSPNADSEVELVLHAGDIIYVLGQVDSDGFYQGETESGEIGLVPSNYLRPESKYESDGLVTHVDGPSNSVKDFISYKDVEVDKEVESEQTRKKKKGLFSKGKKLVMKLGRTRQK